MCIFSQFEVGWEVCGCAAQAPVSTQRSLPDIQSPAGSGVYRGEFLVKNETDLKAKA